MIVSIIIRDGLSLTATTALQKKAFPKALAAPTCPEGQNYSLKPSCPVVMNYPSSNRYKGMIRNGEPNWSGGIFSCQWRQVCR